MEWQFEVVAGPFGGTTEGPAWDGKAVLFTHIPTSRILRYEPATGECSEFRTETHGTNGLMFDARGRLYGCQAQRRCICRFESDGSMTPLPNKLDGKRHNRPNDLAIDRKGRIWFTDQYGRVPVEEREIDHGSVLRLDPGPDGEWTLQRMTFDTTSPNGILFSRDERTLYVAQSDNKGGERDLRAYPLERDDTLGGYTVLHTFGKDTRGLHRGVDGMCLDTNGHIIACAGSREAGPGPMIYVFDPAGRVLETHPVPVQHPTNCTFGDVDLGTLYVTTGGGYLLRVRNTGRRGWLTWDGAWIRTGKTR
jgi:gluconolactonase